MGPEKLDIQLLIYNVGGADDRIAIIEFFVVEINIRLRIKQENAYVMGKQII